MVKTRGGETVTINVQLSYFLYKKTGQGLCIVQDFRELNEHSHIDKNSMKEIN